MNANPYGFLLVYSEEDECFIARCPEFEGVAGHGDSREEALREAEVSLGAAMALYRDRGWTLPAAEVQVEYSGQIRLRLPRTLHRALSEDAAREGVSLNQFMVTLLAARRERHEITQILKEVMAGRPHRAPGSSVTRRTTPRPGVPGTV